MISEDKLKKILIIAGPTASGKTGLAIKLAKKYGAEIINADSLQIYKENPIISAQPSLAERENIKHHLLGYISGREEYNISHWLSDTVKIIKNSKVPLIIVGGTGFFIKHLIFGMSHVPEIPNEIRTEVRNLYNKIGSLEFYQKLKELDPYSAEKISPNNGHKTMRAYEVIVATGKNLNYWQQQKEIFFPIELFKMIILSPQRETLYSNCNTRFLEMLENDVLSEVKSLIDQNFNAESAIMKSHGVPELSKYIKGEWTLEKAIERSQQVVRNYAKRQTTWFKHQFNHPLLEKTLL